MANYKTHFFEYGDVLEFADWDGFDAGVVVVGVVRCCWLALPIEEVEGDAELCGVGLFVVGTIGLGSVAVFFLPAIKSADEEAADELYVEYEYSEFSDVMLDVDSADKGFCEFVSVCLLGIFDADDLFTVEADDEVGCLIDCDVDCTGDCAAGFVAFGDCTGGCTTDRGVADGVVDCTGDCDVDCTCDCVAGFVVVDCICDCVAGFVVVVDCAVGCVVGFAAE